jgi:hypothetical protein
MENILAVLQHATADLPSAADVQATSAPPTARDWGTFFQTLAAFAAALLPLLIQLIAKTKPE